MFLYMAADLVQLRLVETEIRGKGNGLKPELRLEIVARDVDVRWLVVLPAVEMKPVGADAKNGWHDKRRILVRRNSGKQADEMDARGFRLA